MDESMTGDGLATGILIPTNWIPLFGKSKGRQAEEDLA